MNCQNCNTNVDYRFLTNCTQCNAEVERASVPLVAPVPDLEPVERGLEWHRRLINVVYVFIASIAGMISGAVVVYFGAAAVYLAFFSNPGGNPSEQCARGMAVGFLSMVSGAFLGTVGGTTLAVKHPLCRDNF